MSDVLSTQPQSVQTAEVASRRSYRALIAFAAIATALVGCNLYSYAERSDWARLFGPTASLSPDEMVFRFSFLPRLAVSALAGSGLGVASFVLQRLLRNPLADTASLGIAAGASLSMVAVSLWAPALFNLGQEWVALCGGLVAFGLVMFITGRSLSPVRLISAGLVVSLLCGSVNAVLTLFNKDALQNVFIWSSGSLNQNSWAIVYYLLPRIAAAAAVAVAFNRPLFVLSLGDDGARNLGISVSMVRILGLIIAVSLSSTIVSAVGVIGFVGMAAPILARLLCFRQPLDQLLASLVVGALLLVIADQTTLLIANLGREIPTGAITAAVGSPLLILLLPRLKGSLINPVTDRADVLSVRTRRPFSLLGLLALVLGVVLVVVFLAGQNQAGWHLASVAELERYIPWRWPRIVAALTAGAMLGTAGAVLQRITSNPMASPEILGVSSGASLGVIILVFFGARELSSFATLAAAVIGAAGTLAGMLFMGRRFAFSPEHTLLLGIASGTIFTALFTILISSGDQRFGFLLAWMAGSTYGISGSAAIISAATAAILLPLTLLAYRWIEILGLGETMSRQAGITIEKARGALLLLTALLTAGAVLLIGPLSFVGLIGPHVAKSMGLQRPVHQVLGGMIFGALVMVTADWLGRNLLFPYQAPAGLLASLVGGPYFLALHTRERR